MITTLRLENFKCFADQTIPLAKLTLLTGRNGMGKSSVIQSLLLLRQSAREGMLPGKGLLLNGSLTTNGTARDVLYESAAVDEVGIAIKDDNVAAAWRFSAERRYDDVMPVLTEPAGVPDSPIFADTLIYLAAERIGPRDVYDISDYRVERLRDVSSDGTLAVAFLDAHGDDAVEPAMVREAPGKTLAAQTAAWMGEVSPGVRLATNRDREMNRARLGFTFSLGRATSQSLRPRSVGFGLSYTLPVVVALLASRPGAVVLVENPEAHLHPRGQAAMGELMARAAAAGVQVLAETHSDHVLNGVRVAVKQGLVLPTNIAFHYFERADVDERLVHTVTSPRIDADGRIDQWPVGFFDQWDVALEKLL